MATTPTSNDVPSESPRDLKFNAGKIDEFVTSFAKQYIDRFGNAHYTIEGLRYIAQQAIANFGWITVKSFQDGATLTLPNEVLYDESTGEYYRWDGDLPKTVPSGSTPETTGGIGAGAWLSVGDAVLRNNLVSDADGMGDALVTVKQPFTGAVARTQHDKNIETISVLDFGAKLDGSTDDTAAIQAAIDAVSERGGGLVNVPGGICCITGGITIPQYVYICGSGARATEFLVTSATGDVFNLGSDGYNGIQKCAIRSTTYRTGGITIFIEDGRQTLLEDLYIQNQYNGIVVNGGVQGWLNRIEIMDCTPSKGLGITISGGNDTYIDHVVMDASGTQPFAGITISKTDGVWITDTDIINYNYGIRVTPSDDQYITWVMLNSVACDQCSSSGIIISPSGSGYVKGAFLNGCWTSSCGRGMHIKNNDGALVMGVTITDHHCVANKMDGVLIEAGTDIHINGGIFAGNSGGTNYSYPGIQFGPGLSQFSVIGVRTGAALGFGSLQNYGISIGSGCNNYRIIDNDLSGNYTSAFLDNSYSTSTSRVVSNNLNYPTVVTGNATIPSGATQVSVSHTLGVVPESILLTPLNTGAMYYWVGGLTSTAFIIYTDVSSTSSRQFKYRAEIYNA